MEEPTHEYLAMKRRKLALEYKAKMQELATIKMNKAIKIIELLDEHKTASKAELYFAATEEGQKEIEITMYCKGMLELMRSLKTEIDIKINESYGNF